MRDRLLLAAAVLAASIGFVASANAQAVLSIDPTTQTTFTGTVITMDVDVANVTDLYGYQFDLTFNPNHCARGRIDW
jgi:hypothetical protein